MNVGEEKAGADTCEKIPGGVDGGGSELNTADEREERTDFEKPPVPYLYTLDASKICVTLSVIHLKV